MNDLQQRQLEACLDPEDQAIVRSWSPVLQRDFYSEIERSIRANIRVRIGRYDLAAAWPGPERAA